MNIDDLMKQASGLQQKMQDMQKELADREVTGEAGAGLVKVTLNGRHEARRVEIDASLKDEPIDVLEDLVAAAVTSAAQRLEESQAEAMKSLTGGLGIPGGFNFPFPGS